MIHIHQLIDVHVHYFIKGIVDKVDTSCTAPCFTVLVWGAQPSAMSLRQTTNEQSRPCSARPPGSLSTQAGIGTVGIIVVILKR